MRTVSCWVSVLLLAVLTTAATGQNSSRKIRSKPSETAARAGSAVKWRQDLDAALEESKRTRKPVFWYVPTVAGSPMDRKPEIDRYMMAGPFCWPRLITLLNENYIPVKAVARGRRARDLGLVRGKFIEPGYLVLDGHGKEKRRLDKITTFHPEWFLRPLAKLVQKPVPKRKLPEALAKAWDAVRQGDFDRVGVLLNGKAVRDLGPALWTEAFYLGGVAQMRLGKSDSARRMWALVKDKHPDQLFGWKCAAELEGHGPFFYGFEVYGELPEEAYAGGVPGSRAPKGAYTENELRQRSVRYLAGMQRQDGGFTDSKYDFGGTDSLPNVYVACSALIGKALFFECHPAEARVDPETCGVAMKVRARLPEYFLNPKKLNTKDRDELVWAYAYRARWAAELILSGELKEKKDWYLSRLQDNVNKLLGMQPASGAWYHEYPNPFVTATVLQVLAMAKKAGAEVDTERVTRGISALVRSRGDNGGFTYGSRRRRGSSTRKPRVDVRRAAGRMPLCELALLLWGESKQEQLRTAIQLSFEHHQLLEQTRKYDDHATLSYGGFFFWFDMLGRTDAILALTDKKTRDKFLGQQRQLILAIPEIDGAFVDSHELGRTYGTAMALICLAKIRKGLKEE